MVIQVGVFYVRQIFDIKEFLGFSRSAFGYLHRLVFYVQSKIFVHNQGLYETVTVYIEGGRLFASARNYKRSSRLVDKYRVHFVHDSEVQASLHHRFHIVFQVITKIIKTELVVSSVSYIRVIRLALLVIGHIVDVYADGKT